MVTSATIIAFGPKLHQALIATGEASKSICVFYRQAVERRLSKVCVGNVTLAVCQLVYVLLAELKAITTIVFDCFVYQPVAPTISLARQLLTFE